MAKYLFLVNYTVDGLRELMKDGPAARRKVVQGMVEAAGGKVEALYWALGEYDALAICEFPNHVAAGAIGLAGSASGVIQVQTVSLLTDEEVQQAIGVTKQFLPRGG